jgi:uncharacterized protein YciI
VVGLLESGQLVLAGATLGAVNTGIAVFEAPDEATARRIVSKDPAAQGGCAQGELRAFEAGVTGDRARAPVGRRGR